jgi:glutamate--cysteine ligase
MRNNKGQQILSITGRAIDRVYEQRLAALSNSGQRDVLQGGRKGVEKESLRVMPAGSVSTRPHPPALGSALTGEHITTDYSEALIELVTPAFTQSWALLQYLCDLHQFVYRHIGDELLWATSMPCSVGRDEDIPIAQYGRSNIGRMKTLYREGLGVRYGRMMQAIAGVHFNYSFPAHLWPVLGDVLKSPAGGQDFISAAYFSLLRNYHRHGWLVLYLFGASPAVCKSFLAGRAAGLQELDHATAFAPHATSLRMSDLGYRNKNQAGLNISVNSLEHYVRDLRAAVATPFPAYQDLSPQLSANLLQIENEYYAFIRPKRVARSGERPTRALSRAGVEYVEVRALDVGAFDPVGVNQNGLRFTEAFLALCLLKDSPPLQRDEQQAFDANHVTVARRGREPGLDLRRDGRDVALRDWALALLDEMQGVCELLDNGDPVRPYAAALAEQADKVRDPRRTPSARVLEELHANGECFFDLALRMSAGHRAYFLELYPPNEQRLAEFRAEAEASLQAQARIEASDSAPFEEYVRQYLQG